MMTLDPCYRLHIVGAPSQDLRAALGTVPSLFKETDDSATVHASWISPTDDWAEAVRSELDRGSAAVVVESPRTPTCSLIDPFAGCPVAFLVGGSHAHQIEQLRESTSAISSELTWVEILIVDGSESIFNAREALWEAASTLVAAGLPLDSVPVVTQGEGLVTGDATRGRTRLHMTFVHRPGLRPQTCIKAFGPGTSFEATYGDPSVAAAGEMLAVRTQSASFEPSQYQTPARVALLDAHAFLEGAPVLRGRADRFIRTAHLLSQVVWDDARSNNQTDGRNRSDG